MAIQSSDGESDGHSGVSPAVTCGAVVSIGELRETKDRRKPVFCFVCGLPPTF